MYGDVRLEEYDQVVVELQHTYHYSVEYLADSELQGQLGVAIAQAFVGGDRNIGRLSLDIIKEKVRALISSSREVMYV